MTVLGSKRIIAGLALTSAGSLAFEISLTRVFAVQQFHSFAFVVVSLAVMGTAASGLVMALRPRAPSLEWLSSAGAVGMFVAYVTINFVPFDSYVVIRDRRQLAVLLIYFLAASVPFFFTGWVTGACLAEAGESASRPYAANLAGAGLGCVVALGAHTLHGVESGMGAAIALAFLGAAAFCARRTAMSVFALLGILVALVGFDPPAALQLSLSPYKPLSSALLSPGARRTVTLYGTGERLDAVESESTHVYPGLSLNAAVALPSQVALYIDGDGPLPVTPIGADSPEAKELAMHLPGGLAYLLRPEAEAMILEPGGGLEALVALALGASKVFVAFDEPLVMEALNGQYLAFSRNLTADPRIVALNRSTRGALRSGADFDVVDFALSSPYRPVTAGAYSLSEEYTLTQEAILEAYTRLNGDGLLIMTRWLGTPPSEETRLFATVVGALSEFGVDQPQDRLVAYRGMRTATVIASRRAFTADELNLVRRFLEANGFDPILLPGLDPAELNRFNRLPEDSYHELFEALLGDPAGVEGSYKFDIRPPVDDWPYFFHFFRWSQIPEVIESLGSTWEPFGGSGYLVLILLLAVMAFLSLPLAILPRVLLIGRTGLTTREGPFLLFFASLGAGYLLVEIPLIQQMTLLLDRPSTALAVVLLILLTASGLGSLVSPSLNARKVSLGLILALLATLLILPTVVHGALGWPLSARVAIGMALCVPAGFLMGMPFVAGLRSLSRGAPGLIAWAWAVNGAASGVSGVLAAMIGLTWGLRAAMVAGVLAYVVAAWAGRPFLAQPDRDAVRQPSKRT